MEETIVKMIDLENEINDDIDKLIDIKREITHMMKQVTSPGLMHDTGSLGLVHWDDPEEWYGEGPMNYTHQASLSTEGFLRQEYWSGLLLLLHGIFWTQGWNSLSSIGRRILYR